MLYLFHSFVDLFNLISCSWLTLHFIVIVKPLHFQAYHVVYIIYISLLIIIRIITMFIISYTLYNILPVVMFFLVVLFYDCWHSMLVGRRVHRFFREGKLRWTFILSCRLYHCFFIAKNVLVHLTNDCI